MGKITVIVGEPAVGKSSIVKMLLKHNGPWRFDPTIKFIPCHWSPGDKCILGNYSDTTHQFPGTDRMSMACQPHVVRFIAENPLVNFVIEGDRLGNTKFLNSVQDLGADLCILHVWLRPHLLAARRQAERPDQDERFIRSRETKITNLRMAANERGIPIVQVQSITPADAIDIASQLWRDRL